MPYKPKYCCQCGDKIERIEWNLTTSRRFCEFCETEFKIQDYLPRLVILGGVLLSILGFGTYWQQSGKTYDAVPKKLVGTSLAAEKNIPKQAVVPQVSTNSNVLLSEPPLDSVNGAAKMPTPPFVVKVDKQKSPGAAAQPPLENIYFCGAQTKKGSACTHKVKGGGRCWQHTGQPAMVAQEKLLVVQ